MTKLPSNFELDRYGLHCRLVTEDDAEFITALRADARLGRYIHTGDGDVEAQKTWTRKYKEREAAGEDYYFIFETPIGHNRLGTYRIYDIMEQSFTTGSWVFSQNAPLGSSLLALIIIREVAYDLFPEKVNLFDVKKANTSVLEINMSFEPTQVGETEDTLYFRNTREEFERNKQKYIKMLAGRMERMCQKFDEQLNQC